MINFLIKKRVLIAFAVFSRIFGRLRGMVPTPDAINREVDTFVTGKF